SSCRSAETLPSRMRSARKLRVFLSFPPSYTLRTIGIIGSPEMGSAAAQGFGERAVQKRPPHPQEARLQHPARRLHQLAVGAGDVAADVVFAEMKDGAPGTLPGRLVGVRRAGRWSGGKDGGDRRTQDELSVHLPSPAPALLRRSYVPGACYFGGDTKPLLRSECIVSPVLSS